MYIMYEDYKHCCECGDNVDPDEKCNCEHKDDIVWNSDETLLNHHGRYLVNFAENHRRS